MRFAARTAMRSPAIPPRHDGADDTPKPLRIEVAPVLGRHVPTGAVHAVPVTPDTAWTPAVEPGGRVEAPGMHSCRRPMPRASVGRALGAQQSIFAAQSYAALINALRTRRRSGRAGRPSRGDQDAKSSSRHSPPRRSRTHIAVVPPGLPARDLCGQRRDLFTGTGTDGHRPPRCMPWTPEPSRA